MSLSYRAHPRAVVAERRLRSNTRMPLRRRPPTALASSKRCTPERSARMAKLAMSAGRVAFRKPRYGDDALPSHLDLSVVQVRGRCTRLHPMERTPSRPTNALGRQLADDAGRGARPHPQQRPSRVARLIARNAGLTLLERGWRIATLRSLRFPVLNEQTGTFAGQNLVTGPELEASKPAASIKPVDHGGRECGAECHYQPHQGV
jgi:hypothetical protein